MSKIAIVIPARYGSTRFPGKPLAEISGKSMLQRVAELAEKAAAGRDDIDVLVTTEDERIADHAKGIGAKCVMTSPDCPTGSDRALEAIQQLDEKPDFVLNLQGDAPFTPLEAIEKMLGAFDTQTEVVTPVHQLRWGDLDRLRESKKTTPFSGTTAIINENSEALWFSKNIIPGIRKEDDLRESSELSPVHQHMGLYGFRVDILERFVTLPQSNYEQLEGLEQLRMLENGIAVRVVKIHVEPGRMQSGIDTPEDLERAEKLLTELGESA